MIGKIDEKNQAIILRRSGHTYREILQRIPVAKSSLSLWLKSVSLSKSQVQRISQKKLESAKRGGMMKKLQRLKIEEKIKQEAKTEVSIINKRDLWLMGTMLYWAEGSKPKTYNPSVGLKFSNSDFRMINIFIRWCNLCLNQSPETLGFSIYVHKSHIQRIKEIKQYWSKQIGLPMSCFDKIYVKKNALSSNRRHIDKPYYGQVVVTVFRSTNLNRKIEAWIDEIYKQCGVV